MLTEDAEKYLAAGMPEVQVYNALPPKGIALADLKVRSMTNLWQQGCNSRSSSSSNGRAAPASHMLYMAWSMHQLPQSSCFKSSVF